MEIRFIGHSCFEIKSKELTLVIDPYNPEKTGYKLPKLKADVTLTTHSHEDHNFVEGVSDCKLLIQSPGEYETKGVFIFGIDTYHDAQQGSERGRNTIYLIDIEGFSILHLGDLGHELSQETLGQISTVDVLMIPVGGKYTIDSEIAAKVISSLEPGYVIPMHYATKDSSFGGDLTPLGDFLEEMGVGDNVKEKDSLKLVAKSDIPQETEVMVLNPQH